MNWFSTDRRADRLQPPHAARAPRLRGRRGLRHRRRRGRARRRALDRRRLPPRDDRRRLARHGVRAAHRRRQRDDQHPQRATKRRSSRGARRGARRTASRSSRPSCSCIVNLPKRSTGHRRERADARRRAGGVRRARRSEDRRRADVRAGARNEVIVGRVGAARSSRAPTSARSCSSGRTTGRWSASSRPTASISESEIWADAAVLAPAYRRGIVVSERRREARLARQLPAVQGRADGRPAREPEDRARDRVLRRAVADARAHRQLPGRHRHAR